MSGRHPFAAGGCVRSTEWLGTIPRIDLVRDWCSTHYRICTLRAYCDRIKRFIPFHGKRNALGLCARGIGTASHLSPDLCMIARGRYESVKNRRRRSSMTLYDLTLRSRRTSCLALWVKGCVRPIVLKNTIVGVNYKFAASQRRHNFTNVGGDLACSFTRPRTFSPTLKRLSERFVDSTVTSADSRVLHFRVFQQNRPLAAGRNDTAIGRNAAIADVMLRFGNWRSRPAPVAALRSIAVVDWCLLSPVIQLPCRRAAGSTRGFDAERFRYSHLLPTR